MTKDERLFLIKEINRYNIYRTPFSNYAMRLLIQLLDDYEQLNNDYLALKEAYEEK